MGGTVIHEPDGTTRFEAEAIDNLTKPWKPQRPFQRFNSPSFDTRRQRADGDGHRRGNRRRADYVFRDTADIIRSRVMSTVPSWATVDGDNEAQAEKELYGQAVRSYQTWTDAPASQWHRWYDWNVFVEPSRGFEYLAGFGNAVNSVKPNKDIEGSSIPVIGPMIDLFRGPTGKNQFTVPSLTMEVEWDCGAIDKNFPNAGPMYAPRDKPDHDWAWPEAGDYVWAIGRWIYDGGHEKKEVDGKLTTRSELHPCKALAKARSEAVKFPENNNKFTQAMQLMFFTSRFGGYLDPPLPGVVGTVRDPNPPTIAPFHGQDYVFIVDLPLQPELGGPAAVAIGHTGTFPLNTVVLRQPELLVKCDFTPFVTSRGDAKFDLNTGPADALLPHADGVPLKSSSPNLTAKTFAPDPAKPRQRQIKITIPIGAIAATGADFYGVIISLGWRDLDGELAKKVKKCTVRFKKMKVSPDLQDRDTFQEEWRFKAGVNGRWRQWEFGGVGSSRIFSNTEFNLETQGVVSYFGNDVVNGRLRGILRTQGSSLVEGHPRPIVLHLHEDDTLRFSAHCHELDVVDDRYFDFHEIQRRLRFDVQEETDERELGEDPIIRAAALDETDVADQVETLAALLRGLPDVTLSPTPSGERDVDWKQHIDKLPHLRDGSHPIQRAVVRRFVRFMARTFNDQNEPVGIIDPAVGHLELRANPGERGINPLQVKVAPDRETDLVLKAYFTWEMGDLAELLERPHNTPADADNDEFTDYLLTVSVKVTEQD